jgi:hypothetical protein
MTSTDFNVSYSYMHGKYLNHFTLFTLFIFPPPLAVTLSLVWTLLHVCHSLFSVCSLLSGVLPWYFICKYIVLQSVIPSLLLFLVIFPPNLHCSIVFSVFYCVYSYIAVMYFSIIHTLSFFFSFSLNLLKQFHIWKHVLHIRMYIW